LSDLAVAGHHPNRHIAVRSADQAVAHLRFRLKTWATPTARVARGFVVARSKYAGYVPIPGSERPQVPGSALLGPVKASDKIGFTVLLRQHPDSPGLHPIEHWQDTPPSGRQFYSAEEFMRTHGAADEDVRALIDFLESESLRVIEADAGRRRVLVEGTASRINSAFDITLNRYRAPHRFVSRPIRKGDGTIIEGETITEHEHQGFEGPVSVPSALAGVVSAVIGLDNRRLGGPAGTGTGDPPGATSLTPPALAQLYDFPNTLAAGQTIGLFAAADEGAAYLPADVTQFIGSLPTGFNTPPIVTPIGLTVGLTTYGNNTSLITGGSPPPAAYETTQDVQTSSATGQGANVNVYFTENSEAGWEAFLQRAIIPQPGDNPPSVLSASWVLYLDDSEASIGNPALSGSFANIVSGWLQSAAMRGISAFIAIGDWGSADQINDTHCHVGYPNSDPWFTGCGGTIIGAIGSPVPPFFEEWAWSDANTGSQFDSPPYDATGGGVSNTFTVPPYQTSAGVLPISKNDGNSRRGVPDVAGMVALTGFFMDGSGYSVTGTSCVAPLYAGLIATVNAFLGHSVGFLNPTLYEYGPEICNDIKVGNNDSGSVPDAPFYVTAIGWDPCTGWGSIDGLRLLSALAPAPIVVTATADSADFGDVCVGNFADQTLTINNSGFNELLISAISVSPTTDFAAPGVSSYPLAVAPGGSIDVVIRFQPSGLTLGSQTATVTIFSNELFSPHTITVTGNVVTPRLTLLIANDGDFGKICTGRFVDEPLILSNSGRCPLSVTSITSSSAAFVVPSVLSYPVRIAPGGFVPVPIRFSPIAVGAAAATITVISDDPASPATVDVSGDTPSGTLAVSGSTSFGGVQAGCCADRSIYICNVGDCTLHVTSVHFKRKSRQWRLLHNPFPTDVPPGACLPLVIQYRAIDMCPRPCELIIESDDQATPIKTLELLAYTMPSDCGCTAEHRDECCRQGYACCCDDEECEEGA
jgi:hypothetical protein